MLPRIFGPRLGVALWSAAALSLPAQVVINEIHYAPDVKTELVEFLELYNAGNSAVNLSGWQFTDGIAFTFPNGTTLAAGGYLVVAQNPTALQTKFGVASFGPWAVTKWRTHHSGSTRRSCYSAKFSPF